MTRLILRPALQKQVYVHRESCVFFFLNILQSRVESQTLVPFTHCSVNYSECALLLDPSYVQKIVGEGCSRAKESTELYMSDIAQNHRAFISLYGYDVFHLNCETQFPFYRSADPVCADTILEQWEQAFSYGVENESIMFSHWSFAMIHDPGRVARLHSLLDLHWCMSFSAIEHMCTTVQ